jgi:UDP-2,3-diacylglucosamine pyrophosphatase LpxH
MPTDYRIEQRGAVTSVYFDVKVGWEQWCLFRSDAHHDSILCNRDYQLQHLKEAKQRDALIFDWGDFFDAMQGRFDPRRNMDELRPEYRRAEYFDFVPEDSAKYLEDYAEHIALMCMGNHETAVLKNANINLTDRLVYQLNTMRGSKIKVGGYGGWVRFMFNMSDGKSTGPRKSWRVKYFHGSGGEAPVTRGVIQTARQAVYLPDANVVVNGHNHHQYVIPIARERLSNKGKHYSDIQYHVRTPGYKQDYGDGTKGWNVERGGVPKPIGAVWMILKCVGKSEIRAEFLPSIQGPDMVLAPAGDGGYDNPYPQDSEYP